MGREAVLRRLGQGGAIICHIGNSQNEKEASAGQLHLDFVLSDTQNNQSIPRFLFC